VENDWRGVAGGLMLQCLEITTFLVANANMLISSAKKVMFSQTFVVFLSGC